MTNKLSFFVILLIVFIDWMGIGLVYPMFSSMLFSKDTLFMPLEASDSVRGTFLGILVAATPTMQFFSSPLLGSLSDRKGRKPILIISLIIGAIGYLVAVFGVSVVSVSVLVISRVIIGLSSGSDATVGAAIADISMPNDKAKNYSLYNMARGIGFTAGPFLGGLLSSMDLGFISGFEIPFAFAGSITLLNLVLVYFCFDETVKELKQDEKINVFKGLQNAAKALSMPGWRMLYLSVFLFCFGWSFYWEFVPATWIAQYQFSPATIGTIYAVGACFYAFSSGVLTRPILKRYPPSKILSHVLVYSAFSIWVLYFNSDVNWIWIYLPMQQFLIALMFPSAATIVSDSAGKDRQGEALGVLGSVQCVAFAASPLLAGSLLGFTIQMPILIGGGAVMAAAFAFWATPAKMHGEVKVEG